MKILILCVSMACCLIGCDRKDETKSPHASENTQKADSKSSGHRFTILTKDRCGFSDGKKTYLTSGEAANFIKDFGAPDESRGVEYGFYFKDGILFENTTSGTNFCFYLRDRPIGSESKKGHINQCDCMTDTGLGAGSTLDDVLKAYGAPTQNTKGANDDSVLEYRNDKRLLIFGFQDNLLVLLRMGLVLDQASQDAQGEKNQAQQTKVRIVILTKDIQGVSIDGKVYDFTRLTEQDSRNWADPGGVRMGPGSITFSYAEAEQRSMSMETDMGIKAGATIDEVRAIYGKPVSSSETALYYDKKSAVIVFNFRSGRLNEVMIFQPQSK